jgi:charged multivesicular body protein 2A
MPLFGRQVPPEERLKSFKQSLRKSVREIDRARARLQTEEAKVKQDIKRLTQRNEMESVMILCKDLVRNRAAAQKFLKLSSQLESLGLRIETIKAQAGAAKALKGAAAAMHQLNQMTNVPEMQAIVQKFIMENEMMDAKNEMVDEAIDMGLDTEGTLEEETAAQYAKIFEEMGMPVPPQIAAQVAGGQALPLI